jgi:hypothetical protein
VRVSVLFYSVEVVLRAAKTILCAYGQWGSMASSVVDWWCPSCHVHSDGGHKLCSSCDTKSMLHCECMPTGWTGSYSNWHTRHRAKCEYCSPELAKQLEHERESKRHSKHKALTDTSKGRFFHSSFSHLREERNANSITTLCLLVGVLSSANSNAHMVDE